MKIQVERVALVRVLQLLQGVAEKRATIPILSSTLMRSLGGDILEFSATGLELSLRTQMGARTEEPGVGCVSVKKLLETAQKLPWDHIALEIAANGNIIVRAEQSSFELAGSSAEDFPYVDFFDDLDFVACNAAVLRSCLERAIYAVPLDEDPFNVAGLFCHPSEGNMVRFVASDGHRLAYSQMPFDGMQALQLGKGIVIPSKGVQEILKLLKKETKAFLAVHENCLILKTLDALLKVQLLDKEFPKYQVIISEERPFGFNVDKEAFHAALKRMVNLSRSKLQYVRFIIQSGVLELEVGGLDSCRAHDTLDVEYEGDKFMVSFNARYVADAIHAAPGPLVRFEWANERHGCVFIGMDDPSYLALIMPAVYEAATVAK